MTIDTFRMKLDAVEDLLSSTSNYEEVERQARQLLGCISELPTVSDQEITMRLQYRVESALVMSLWRLGRAAEGREVAEHALELSRSLVGEAGGTMEARALANLGNVLDSLTEFPKALELFMLALAMHERLGNQEDAAYIMGSIGNVHANRADYTQALEYMNAALSRFESLGMKEDAARVTGNLGNVHWSLADYDKAQAFYHRALEMHEELGMTYESAVVLGNTGLVYMELADYAQALEYFHRAMGMHEQKGMQEGVAYVTAHIGLVYLHMSDFERALEFFSRALEIDERLGLKAPKANVLANMGTVYEGLADFDNALDYMMRALEVFEEIDMKSMVSHVTGTMGNVYVNLGDFEKAMQSFRKALDESEQLGDRRQQAYWLHGIGTVHRRRGNEAQSEEALMQALQMRRVELQSDEGVSDTLLELGRLRAQQARTKEAIALLKEALLLSERHGKKSNQCSAHEELSSIYTSTRQYRRALEHYTCYHQLEREIHSEEAVKKAENFEQQRRISALEKRFAAQQAAEKAVHETTVHLLHKVLPPSISTRLLQGERIADYFQYVSILFADIVGFTPIAARMPAKAVLAFLNYVFGEFDAIVAKHGCQKIKTIGDGYMAVCGAPIPCDDHAERLARTALELMNDIRLPDEVRESLPTGSVFDLRIGLHTGSAFAGIVGENGFVYDVYSDAVNLASRMESSGVPGRIHCSEEFVLHLQNRDESFVFEERGEIDIKGKGAMRTYFLEKA